MVEINVASAFWGFLFIYLSMVSSQMYTLWFPPQCSVGQLSKYKRQCITPVLRDEDSVDVRIYVSPSASYPDQTAELMLQKDSVDPSQGFQETMTVPLMKYGTRQSGLDLYAHIFLLRSSKTGLVVRSIDSEAYTALAHRVVPLTRALPYRATSRQEKRNLLQTQPSTSPNVDQTDLSSSQQESAPKTDEEQSLTTPESEDLLKEHCIESTEYEKRCTAEHNSDNDVKLGDTIGSSAEPVNPTVYKSEEASTELANPTDAEEELFDWGDTWLHLRPRIAMSMVSRHPPLLMSGLAADLRPHVLAPQPSSSSSSSLFSAGYMYGPLVDTSDPTLLRRHWRPLSRDQHRQDPQVEVSLVGTSLGMFRLISLLQEGVKMWGLPEKDLEELKEVVVTLNGGSWRFFILSTVIGILHSVFAFLAFKNDVGFWKARTSLEGLSVRTFFSSFICQLIIFLKLADAPNVSNIILFEVGIGAMIEGWKVWKIMGRRGMLSLEYWSSSRSDQAKLVGSRMSGLEAETDEYDRRAMQLLGRALYPLVLLWALYSILYLHHRSWWSWLISCLANGVYLYGFIAMTPQLYINYRLKSVAHIPWRAFMYKAFNTFVDDVFAFAIDMPLTHRIACLRDDVIFFIYLYQRRIYPIDKTRPNEFGRAYADDQTEDKTDNQESKSASNALTKMSIDAEKSGCTDVEQTSVPDGSTFSCVDDVVTESGCVVDDETKFG